MQPCECVAELIETVGGLFCPTCGRGYQAKSGHALLKAIQLHGPILKREEHAEFMEHLRSMRTDDDDPSRDYEQKPETDQ